jgi:uncharacterized protein (DUF2236 family)
MLASGTLAVGPDARRVGALVLRGRVGVPTGPVAWANRLLTAGWLPRELRAPYGLSWTARDERWCGRLVAVLSRARTWLPPRLAWWPEASRRPRPAAP